jgi:hypothetical protein
MLSKISIAGLLIAAATLVSAQNAAPPAVQSAPAAKGDPSERVHTDRAVRFKQIDKNGDGKLSLEEFQYRPEAATPDVRPTKLDAKTLADRAERFKMADKNHDGFLSFEEFKSLETMPPPRPGNQSSASPGH